MEQKLDRSESNCTWDGDVYPHGYTCCEGSTCMNCNNGEWVEQSNPDSVGKQE